MKNIQVIDGADNSTYSVYGVKKEIFNKIFLEKNQDIEFVEDFIKRVGKKKAAAILKELWDNRLDKKTITGIHGTLFYELGFKRKYYPSKIENEMIQSL